MATHLDAVLAEVAVSQRPAPGINVSGDTFLAADVSGVLIRGGEGRVHSGMLGRHVVWTAARSGSNGLTYNLKGAVSSSTCSNASVQEVSLTASAVFSASRVS